MGTAAASSRHSKTPLSRCMFVRRWLQPVRPGTLSETAGPPLWPAPPRRSARPHMKRDPAPSQPQPFLGTVGPRNPLQHGCPLHPPTLVPRGSSTYHADGNPAPEPRTPFSQTRVTLAGLQVRVPPLPLLVHSATLLLRLFGPRLSLSQPLPAPSRARQCPSQPSLHAMQIHEVPTSIYLGET